MATDAYIAGAFEHPTREAPDTSTPHLHAEAARGALSDAGLSKDDVDAYFTAGVPDFPDGPGPHSPPVQMADFLNLDVSFVGSTDVGGAAYVSHVGHALRAIRDGRCEVALVTFAARPRSREEDTGTALPDQDSVVSSFEVPYGETVIADAALQARRHMHEYGTTEAQLAAVRAAAAHHAQYNDDAVYREPVTVEDVLASKTVAAPLHVLDCCVISDGAGAVVVVSDAVAKRLDRHCVGVLGHGEHVHHTKGGNREFTATGARRSGPDAYAEAGIEPTDVDYASIYDAFTILVVKTVEDLGFCEKGEGGAFVANGGLEAPDGALPFNTDGGGLCNNHPTRGGMLKMIETVRQLRGEAHPQVQVPDCEVALAHATGGGAGGHCSVTLVLGGDR